MESKPTVVLSGPRAIVWNLKDAARLYKEGFYGKFVGVNKPKTPDLEKPLELSLIETIYLLEKGRIKVVDEEGKELSLDEVRRIAEKEESFNDHYRVYKDLREKGYVVRPGLKFGATFAVYKYGPGIDHAPFLVHVVPPSVKMDPIEVVRAGRLSHSVRKRFILATTNPSTKELNYYMFSWWRP
ncbi:MAG: tRNA-intron lyase [Thermoprotei archaeon]|nr:MAG: tRNA-intron lyase [Thermoprotei archaeon]RLF18479.1 MAG: tRNA-intron lyase [Thermoprotei archaeon]